MRKRMLFVVLVIVASFLISCAHQLIIQSHIGTDVQRKLAADYAGLYIPSSTLTMEYEKFTFFAGNTVMPLGTPVKDLAQEAFAPFYRRVFYQARRDLTDIDHLIEVSIDDFKMTQGLDSHVIISISVSDFEESLWSGTFAGKGSGNAGAGSLSGFLARSQLKKSASDAFADAFTKARAAYNEFLIEQY